MRKTMIFIVCFVAIVFSLCSCSRKPVNETYCNSLLEAEKKLKFEFNAPETIGEATTRVYRAYGRMLEIQYFNGKVMTAKISKSDNGENIGRNNVYANEMTIKSGDMEYTFYNNEGEEIAHMATWTKGKYSYFVMHGPGLSYEDMIELCNEIE